MNKYLCFSKNDNMLKVFYENSGNNKGMLEHSQIIIYEQPRDEYDSKTIDTKYVFSTYEYQVDLLDIHKVFHQIMAEHFPFVDTPKTRSIYDTTQSICNKAFEQDLNSLKPIKEEPNQLSLF